MKKINKLPVRSILKLGICMVLFIASAQVAYSLPGAGGVPFTFQTFAAALAGFMLGTRRSAILVSVYILLGMVGLPVFALGYTGIAHVLGPTGGFLIGFVPMAALCGRRRAYWAAAGLICCHLIGLLWFSNASGVSVRNAFVSVSLPFWLKDAASVVFAHLTARMINVGFRKSGFHKRRAAGIPYSGESHILRGTRARQAGKWKGIVEKGSTMIHNIAKKSKRY